MCCWSTIKFVYKLKHKPNSSSIVSWLSLVMIKVEHQLGRWSLGSHSRTSFAELSFGRRLSLISRSRWSVLWCHYAAKHYNGRCFNFLIMPLLNVIKVKYILKLITLIIHWHFFLLFLQVNIVGWQWLWQWRSLAMSFCRIPFPMLMFVMADMSKCLRIILFVQSFVGLVSIKFYLKRRST